ncbi:glutamate racemase [Clostridium algifaecis]|uniref:Glutamate racemase n=1 Tax=Clostridium algifaecis TaxID=1472040 RepID=A0ABS4KV89_9CLOT|nr:glutamate racemase [Clostridium algifaecis]MBP2033957.1 glutamate racemase [Clostridium algifaecis]
MDLKDRPIGFFDSGVGGLSVLKQAVKILPHEDFVYYGDSLNAPYGIRTSDKVKELTFNAVKILINKNIKALVVACNTATSVSIEDLRKQYAKSMPIIGIEPALKPAVKNKKNGKIIIMATPVTLSESKFNNLMKKYNYNDNIVPMPCPGLVELIESGIVEGPEVEGYLKERYSCLIETEIASIVLGCTHYPFVKKALIKVVGEMGKDPFIIDGSSGTVNQLKRQLLKYDMIKKPGDEKGTVRIFNSLDTKKIIDLSYKLLSIK